MSILFNLGVLGLRAISRPIASTLRRGVDMHPKFQQFISQIAQKKQIEEKIVTDAAAQFLVVSTIAGSIVAYQSRRRPQLLEKVRSELEQKLAELEQELANFIEEQDSFAKVVDEVASEIDDRIEKKQFWPSSFCEELEQELKRVEKVLQKEEDLKSS